AILMTTDASVRALGKRPAFLYLLGETEWGTAPASSAGRRPFAVFVPFVLTAPMRSPSTNVAAIPGTSPVPLRADGLPAVRSFVRPILLEMFPVVEPDGRSERGLR